MKYIDNNIVCRLLTDLFICLFLDMKINFLMQASSLLIKAKRMELAIKKKGASSKTDPPQVVEESNASAEVPTREGLRPRKKTPKKRGY